jgi:hypothetical protein
MNMEFCISLSIRFGLPAFIEEATVTSNSKINVIFTFIYRMSITGEDFIFLSG